MKSAMDDQLPVSVPATASPGRWMSPVLTVPDADERLMARSVAAVAADEGSDVDEGSGPAGRPPDAAEGRAGRPAPPSGVDSVPGQRSTESQAAGPAPL